MATRGRGLMNRPSPPLTRKSSVANSINSEVESVQNAQVNVNEPSNSKPKTNGVKEIAKEKVHEKASAVGNLDTEALNPGWEDINISHLIKRPLKKEPRDKAQAQKTIVENQPVSAEQNGVEPVGQNGISNKAMHHVDKTQPVAKLDSVVDIDTLIIPPKEDENGWASYDISAYLKHLREKKAPPVPKAKLSVSKVPEVNNNVVSPAVVGDEVGTKLNVSKEPIPIASSSKIPVKESKEDVKLPLEMIKEKSSAFVTPKKSDYVTEMTGNVPFTREDCHEFHDLFKSCSETFEKLSKLFLKVGSRT